MISHKFANGMTISVIVPVYNAVKTLPRCIASLKHQDISCKEIELIFVDNGSTDGSLEFLLEETGILALQEAKQGAYCARNLGALRSSGDILAFTDPDCVVSSGWLRAAVDTLCEPDSLVALGIRRPYPDRGL